MEKRRTKYSVDINCRDSEGWTPLMKTALAKKNFLALVDVFLENGADMNAVEGTGKNLIYLATWAERPMEELEELVKRGANWKTSRQPALHAAAEKGYLDGVQYFLYKGGNVNSRNGEGATPLMCVAKAKKNFSPISGLLVDHGANWRLKDSEENSLLHWAAEGGNVEAVKFAISKGVDVNGSNVRGRTPLMKAAAAPQNFLKVVDLLIKNGGDITARDTFGYSILWFAALNRRPAKELAVLVAHGAGMP